MIRISIVDDEEIIREKISSLVSETLAAEPVEAELRTYPDGESFLGASGTDGPSDILLADIQMAGMDGMELGRKIRRDNPGMYIIFITSYEQYAAESYRIEAYQYILKQDLEARLPGDPGSGKEDRRSGAGVPDRGERCGEGEDPVQGYHLSV